MTPEQKQQLEVLVGRMEPLAERWKNTEVWHAKAPHWQSFRVGRIHTNTGHLEDLYDLLNLLKETILK